MRHPKSPSVRMKLRAALVALAVMASLFMATSASAVTGCSAHNGSLDWTAGVNYTNGSFCMQSYNDASYYLVYQGDGNLVMYHSGVPIWSSGTANKGAKFSLQGDGNVVIYNASGAHVWAASDLWAFKPHSGTNTIWLFKLSDSPVRHVFSETEPLPLPAPNNGQDLWRVTGTG